MNSDTLINLPIESPQPVLALGPELKSTVCLLVGRQARISPDHGHLGEPDAYRRFVATVERMQAECDPPPKVLACDMHPDYAATRYARGMRDVRVIPIQHHHAHIAAAAAEHGLTGEVVGLACDGTGYGTDGAIWGGEVILAREDGSFRRAGHLTPFPLSGGDAAAIDTWRPAAGIVQTTYGPDWPDHVAALFSRVDAETLALLRQRLASDSARIVQTSSMGRLFDAVAFLLGLCDRNHTEAAAPIAVQKLADSIGPTDPLAWDLAEADELSDEPPPRRGRWSASLSGEEDQRGLAEHDRNTPTGSLARHLPQRGRGEETPLLLDTRPTIRAIIDGVVAGEPRATLARGFHEALGAMLTEAARRVCSQTGVGQVVLSGGCFLNGLLRDILRVGLDRAGLNRYTHDDLSPGDACVSLGQAVIAAQTLRAGAH